MKNSRWKILNQKDVSPSQWFPVLREEIELPNGKVIDYYKSKLPNVSMIIPITKQKEVIFVKQYKHGIEEVCIEFPAGRIEKGKTAREAAAAELAEETGIIANGADLIELIELWIEPSKSSVKVSGFIIPEVEITQHQNLEETESIEVVKIPTNQLDAFILSGKIHASDTVALLFYARMKFPEFFSN
jgi:8-oxo-dGTP pyrophosphatase MutT (NUDIX family)